MGGRVDFHEIFMLLREWFDTPTPRYDDFDRYRFQLYDEYSSVSLVGSVGPNRTSHECSLHPRSRLPLKIWWPHYTAGDYRFELCVGALLVHQTSWRQVEKAIKGIEHHLVEVGKEFNAAGIAGISQTELESLIRSTGFFRQKAKRIKGFSEHVHTNYGTIERFMEWGRGVGKKRQLVVDPVECGAFDKEKFGDHLRGLGLGFGNETRDSVLLYAANIPVFIADAYARKLLAVLGSEGGNEYDVCQRTFEDGVQRDFSKEDIREIAQQFTPEERNHALVNSPPIEDASLILLYQVFHAAIDELGISKRWDEFRSALNQR